MVRTPAIFRAVSLLSLLCTALWGAALTAQAAPESTAPLPHRIGVVYALSGAAHVWGTYGRMGLELARDEINAAGGVAGRPIELIFEDSQTQSASAVSAYRKLVTIQKVPIVIGDVWEFLTNPLIPLANRDGTLLLSPTSTPKALQQTGPTTFTLGHPIKTIQESVRTFFARNPNTKRIGILCWDDPWGAEYLQAWRDAIIANGATEVVAVCTSDFNTDFRTEVLKVASKRVDGIFIAHLADVALKRIREQGLKVTILTTSNVVEDLTIKRAPQELFEGVFFTDWRPSPEFIQKFSARYATVPIVDAHNSYEALRSVAKALAMNPHNPAAALRSVRYTGVAGPLDLSDRNGANHAVAQLYQIRSGQIELVSQTE